MNGSSGQAAASADSVALVIGSLADGRPTLRWSRQSARLGFAVMNGGGARRLRLIAKPFGRRVVAARPLPRGKLLPY